MNFCVCSFWSTLLSATLTYHVNWLHSFISGKKKGDIFDCGTRILVLSKSKSLAQCLLHVLGYFIRHQASSAVSLETKTRTSASAKVDSQQLDSSAGSYVAYDLSQCLNGLSCGDGSGPSSVLSNRDSMGSCGPDQSVRRNSLSNQENARYLRNYYDVRFQLSPSTAANNNKDATAFANVKYSIAKNGFQDFTLYDHVSLTQQPASVASSLSQQAPCSFFVGSLPADRSAHVHESRDAHFLVESATPINVNVARFVFLLLSIILK